MNKLSANGKSCLKCGTRSSARWASGPDGFRTLCRRCECQYRNRRLPVYRNALGNISIVWTPDAQPLQVTGFAKRKDGKNNLLHPITGAPGSPVNRSSNSVAGPWSRYSGKHVWKQELLVDASREADDAERLIQNEKSGQDKDSHEYLLSEYDTGSGQEKDSALDNAFDIDEELLACGDGFENDDISKWQDPNARIRRSMASRLASIPRDGRIRKRNSGRTPVSVKASCRAYGEVVMRRFTVDPMTSFVGFQSLLQRLFRMRGKFAVQYKDDSEDDIAVSSDNEIAELFKVARKRSLSPVRMDLRLKSGS